MSEPNTARSTGYTYIGRDAVRCDVAVSWPLEATRMDIDLAIGRAVAEVRAAIKAASQVWEPPDLRVIEGGTDD